MRRELVKSDILLFFGLLDDFYDGVIDVSRINYGVIIPVPKGKDAGRRYMHIYLLNVFLGKDIETPTSASITSI
jgi:hypothetical protein